MISNNGTSAPESSVRADEPVAFDLSIPPGEEPEAGPKAPATDAAPPMPMSAGELWRRLGPMGLLGIAWTFMPALMGTLLLLNLTTVGDWLVSHQRTGWALYVVIFIFSAGFGMLPTYSQAILGGWAFGFWWGFPAALLGFTGGSLVGYVVARTVGRDRVERLIDENARARAVRDALLGGSFWNQLGTVVLLRLPPNSPFALTNLAMAAAGVRRSTYAIGTAIGMAPRTGVAVFLATQARDLMQGATERPRWLVIGGIVISLAVFAVLFYIGKRAVDRVHSGGRSSPAGGGASPAGGS